MPTVDRQTGAGRPTASGSSAPGRSARRAARSAVAEQERRPGEADHGDQPRHPGQTPRRHRAPRRRSARRRRGRTPRPPRPRARRAGPAGARRRSARRWRRSARGPARARTATASSGVEVNTRSTLGTRRSCGPAHVSDASLASLFMDLDLAQLRALDATVRGGTLEAAARALHVTPSAISQRLRALEVATGRILLVRSKPVQVTESGQAVLRLARQVDLARRRRRPRAGRRPGNRTRCRRCRSRSTPTRWPPGCCPRWRRWPATSASTCTARTRSTPAPCCAPARSWRRSPPTPSRCPAAPPPGWAACATGRWPPPASRGAGSPTGPTAEALARAPVVVFDRKDDLQHRYLRARAGGRRRTRRCTTSPPRRTSSPPSASGSGWGMVPDLQARGRDGRAGRPRPGRRGGRRPVLAAVAAALRHPRPGARGRPGGRPPGARPGRGVPILGPHLVLAFRRRGAIGSAPDL